MRNEINVIRFYLNPNDRVEEIRIEQILYFVGWMHG